MFSTGARLAILLAVSTMVTAGEPGGPGADASSGTGRFAPGGMLLAEQHGHVVIADLHPGSAAAMAGLRQGDVLLAVNEINLIDLEDLSTAAVIALIGGESGPDLRLIVGRKGQTFGVSLPRSFLDGPPRGEPSAAPPALGEQAPSFTATDMQGRTIRLEDLRGKPLLLDFWASWCPPCRASAITLKRFADQFGDRLIIIGVSLDEDRSSFEAFVYNTHLPGYQVFDGGPTGPITTLYDAAAMGIPYSVLIDPDGVVLHMGPSLQAKEKAIARLLEAAEDDNGS